VCRHPAEELRVAPGERLRLANRFIVRAAPTSRHTVTGMAAER
jgi:hypothetical protein